MSDPLYSRIAYRFTATELRLLRVALTKLAHIEENRIVHYDRNDDANVIASLRKRAAACRELKKRLGGGA